MENEWRKDRKSEKTWGKIETYDIYIYIYIWCVCVYIYNVYI